MDAHKAFHFKQFSISQSNCIMKVSTDSVLLGAWANVKKSTKALDIGTGSGILALMMAQQNPTILIHAVEIDKMSVHDAIENVNNSSWSNRIKVYHMAIQEFCRMRLDTYDHIITNPPFFINSTLGPDQLKNTARHTVRLSFEDLLSCCSSLLKSDGILSIILPPNEAKEFISSAILFGFYCIRKMEVYPKSNKNTERVLMEFSRIQDVCTKETLVIQNSDESNDYTEPYKELTKAFYKIF